MSLGNFGKTRHVNEHLQRPACLFVCLMTRHHFESLKLRLEINNEITLVVTKLRYKISGRRNAVDSFFDVPRAPPFVFSHFVPKRKDESSKKNFQIRDFMFIPL